MKELTWLLALSLAAVLVALVVAPQLVALTLWLGASWAPTATLRIAAHASFELPLWGTGVGLFAIARRLGWLYSVRAAVLVTLAAPLAEGMLAVAIGRIPPGFSTPTGMAVRAVVAALALAGAVLLARRRGLGNA